MSLAALEILEEAQFASAQARAIARVLEVESLVRREELATKADLSELRHATKGDLSELRHAVNTGLSELRRVTKDDLAELRHAMNADLSELRHGVKVDLSEFRQTVTADLSRLELKIESAKAEGVRWTILAVIGQATLLAGLMYFLLQNMR
jgi:hypothetical protein